MTIGVHPDIVKALGAIRGDVEHHLASVSRYRAMRSIEETMAEIAEFQDLVTPLRDVRERIERQLQETQEYRALCALDSIVPQLVDVLAFLDEKSNAEVPSPGTQDPVTAEPIPEPLQGTQILDVYERADDAATAKDVVAFVDDIDAISESQGLTPSSQNSDVVLSAIQPELTPELSDISLTVAQDDVAVHPSQIPPLVDSGSSALDAPSEETTSPPVATLAYNLANMLVQSLPPNTGDGRSTAADSPAGLAATTNAEHAAQEGKAA